MRPMTTAQTKALRDLNRGPLHRTPDGSGWINVDGRFVPLIVGSKLRQRGYASFGENCRILHITEKGKQSSREVA